MLQKQARLDDGSMDQCNRSVAQVDLSALRHNLDVVKQHCPNQKIMAMVKSDAYGHGLVPCAQALDSVDGFGVACLSEAVQLRDAGLQQAIFVMSGFCHVDEIALLQQYDLVAVVHQPWQVDAILQVWLSKPLKVWLKLDSGMGRLGLEPAAFRQAYQALLACDHVSDEIGLMTHLACADDPADAMTDSQIDAYWRVVCHMPGPKSIANSGGILHWPKSINNTDWVRPGIMLYGAAPAASQQAADYNLQPVMTLSASVISVKWMQQGDSVGYGQAWRCPEDMRVAVLAHGYGDGLPRTSAGLQVSHAAGKATVIGRVSMDLTTIDCRHLDTVKSGDRVIIWGQGGQSVTTAATQANDFHYELLTRVASRVQRNYTE